MAVSLVAYKRQPAQLLGQDGKKWNLKTSNNAEISVREKDFLQLHPEFNAIKVQSEDAPEWVVPEEIMDLLSEQSIDVEELCSWVFGDYTPQTAWQTYEIVQAQIYCYGHGKQVVMRTPEQAQKILTTKQEEAQEATKRQACVDRLAKKTYADEDMAYLAEIEAVALCQNKHSKILAQLGWDNTPESAHKLLLLIGFYGNGFNPYALRDKNTDYKKQPDWSERDLPKDSIQNRRDLTHLSAFAIDNNNSKDADDAISLDAENPNKFWVHIADAAAFISPNSELDEYAQQRGSTLYFPEIVLPMLPEPMVELLSLGTQETSLALSIGFVLTDNIISDIDICHSTIMVKNTTYEIVAQDLLAGTTPDFVRLNTVAKSHGLWRKTQGSLSFHLPNANIKYQDETVFFEKDEHQTSRDLVAEWMVIAGQVVAQFAIENDFTLPFVTQEDSGISDEIKAKQDNLDLSTQFGLLRQFNRSKVRIEPSLHSGLGLGAYVRSTSPMRRYLDLVTHQQLSHFLHSGQALEQSIIKPLVMVNNELLRNHNKVLRSSQNHYRCVYFLQNPSWRSKALVIGHQHNRHILHLAELGMIININGKKPLENQTWVEVKVGKIVLTELILEFAFVAKLQSAQEIQQKIGKSNIKDN